MNLVPILTILLFFQIACSQSPDLLVVAKVNDEKIRAKEFSQAFQEEKDHFDTALLQEPEGLMIIKKRLIHEIAQKHLLLQKVESSKITLTDEEQKILEDATSFGFTDGEFLRQLQLKKITKEEWVEKQKQKKLIEKLLNQEIFDKVPVGSNEVESYFRKNKSEFSEPDQVRCRQIIVDKKEKAEKILSLLQKGSNFPSVAQDYSEGLEKNKGGDLGWIMRGQYPKVIEDACFTLAVGQMSGVVSSEYGYHIFKVVEKKPGFQKTFNDVKNTIEESLKRAKGEELIQPWLENLNQEAKISIDERALKAVVLK